MTIVHRLVGYDRKTERLGFEKDVPPRLLGMAKELAEVPESDPDAVLVYELTNSAARELARALDALIDLDRMDFFLETFDLDFRKSG